MIDPIHSLAFSMHSNPGVYALLLGSGVSRAAQIPTGWEITLDLIRKLAGTLGESAEPNPEAWFEEKYGETPDYSKLLDALAKTPAERQQLLRPYFEPNEQEREEGVKQPTAAHRAIAQLVASGFVRVIITTNLDQLIESALEDEGVLPDVLSSLDDVQNMRPLIHIQHCVFKVNGDWRDVRIRNTGPELGKYPEEFDQLLDQIIGNFGLVVCGWSAKWDTALQTALLRESTDQYTTYWAVHGKVGCEAQEVIRSRKAYKVPITNADEFFPALQRQVESIEQSTQAQAFTSEVAVDRLEHYLSEPHYRIQLSKHISKTVERVIKDINDQDFDYQSPDSDCESVTARVRNYEAVCLPLLSVAAIGGRWAKNEHSQYWGEAIELLATTPLGGGRDPWLALRKYPGLLLIYALGLGALHSGNLQFLGNILKRREFHETGRSEDRYVLTSSINALGLASLIPWDRLLVGMERHHVPLSDWIHDVLRLPLKETIPSDQRYTLTFDRLEILTALGYYHLQEYRDWFPMGAFVYRSSNRKLILQETRESLTKSGPMSPYVASGIFGESPEECLELLVSFESFVSRVAPQMGIFR